jgi:hypothetical protein
MPYCFYAKCDRATQLAELEREREKKKKKKLQMPNQMRPSEENQQKLRLREQDFRGTQKSTSAQ